MALQARALLLTASRLAGAAGATVWFTSRSVTRCLVLTPVHSMAGGLEGVSLYRAGDELVRHAHPIAPHSPLLCTLFFLDAHNISVNCPKQGQSSPSQPPWKTMSSHGRASRPAQRLLGMNSLPECSEEKL